MPEAMTEGAFINVALIGISENRHVTSASTLAPWPIGPLAPSTSPRKEQGKLPMKYVYMMSLDVLDLLKKEIWTWFHSLRQRAVS